MPLLETPSGDNADGLGALVYAGTRTDKLPDDLPEKWATAVAEATVLREITPATHLEPGTEGDFLTMASQYSRGTDALDKLKNNADFNNWYRATLASMADGKGDDNILNSMLVQNPDMFAAVIKDMKASPGASDINFDNLQQEMQIQALKLGSDMPADAMRKGLEALHDNGITLRDDWAKQLEINGFLKGGIADDYLKELKAGNIKPTELSLVAPSAGQGPDVPASVRDGLINDIVNNRMNDDEVRSLGAKLQTHFVSDPPMGITGDNLLLTAAKYGSEQSYDALKKVLPINSRNDQDENAFIVAARNGNADMVTHVAPDSDLTARTKSINWEGLDWAVASDDPKTVKAVLDTGILDKLSKEDIHRAIDRATNTFNYYGDTNAQQIAQMIEERVKQKPDNGIAR